MKAMKEKRERGCNDCTQNFGKMPKLVTSEKWSAKKLFINKIANCTNGCYKSQIIFVFS